MWRSKSLRIFLGLGISAVLLVLVLRKVDFDEVLTLASAASPSLLALAIGLKLGAIFVKSVRWGLTLGAMLEDKPKHYISATFLGFFGNAVFPAKLGELVRIEVCRRHNHATFSGTLATLLLERTLDALMLLVLVGLATLVYPLPEWMAHGALLVSGMAGVLVLLVVLFASRRLTLPGWLFPGRAGAWVRDKSEAVFERFGVGLAAARSPRVLLACSGLTAVAWSLEVGGTFIALHALGLDLSVAAALSLTVIVAVGSALPAAPAGMGTHQFLCVIALEPFGVSADAGVSFSLMIVFSMILSLSTIGLALTWREGISLSAFRSKPAGDEPPDRG